ncbi:MAG: CoA activase [Acidobacteria bacterium]|nr:CoA activase [Acidobacteriota bacterium]
MGRYIGIDVGAEFLKLVEIADDPEGPVLVRRERLPHGKAPGPLLLGVLKDWDWGGVAGAAATGRLARQLTLTRVPLQQALAAGFRHACGPDPATVVSIGSRGFSVLELREGGQERYRENGRCAQGTGNFLQQLVGRLGLDVAEACERAASASEAAPLSGRCPVILKTDLTHLANKGEAKDRILAGLLDAIAENVETLVRPGACPPRLHLAGGVARAARVRDHFRTFAARHGLTLAEGDPEDALFLEAWGAAWLARDLGLQAVPLTGLLEPPAPPSVPLGPPLAASLGRVRRLPSPPPPEESGVRDLLLGFDIGSTGSKAVAVDRHSLEPLWDAYLGTEGSPVGAAQALMGRFLAGPAARHRLLGFGVTGSGRELVGSLLSSCYGSRATCVVNEIAAHAEGAVACDPRVDTIFEIGGQDAKYIRLAAGRVVDAAMNEACSAGTGSFIEEQGRRFSGIQDLGQLAEAALGAEACASLGQHCSIFMAEVMDEAVATGLPRDQILAGIYDSVVANYLNRVKGTRDVGQVVFCQGMPFASDALAAAVARQTGAEVIVPPRPGLMGALGIARLAAGQLETDLPVLEGARFLEARVEGKDQFVCTSVQGCGGSGNKCRIDRIHTTVGEEHSRHTWGGACSLWDKGARRAKLPDRAPDPFRERRELVEGLLGGLQAHPGRPLVALTDEFQLQGILPFFATFLHRLGFNLRVASRPGRSVLRRGIEVAPVPFCAPMQQYHGLVAGLADEDPDYLFLPMIRELPRVDGEPHSAICPITQGAPDVLRLGLRPGARILSPVVDMGPGFFESPAFAASCASLAAELGLREEDRWRPAFEVARRAQGRFEEGLREAGRRALAFARERKLVAVAVLGRGYTIHNEVLNSNVPAILREQGALPIPVDCLDLPEDLPVFREVYWGHSQRILRAALHVRRTPGLYGIFCSNYACGPDSFTIPLLAWLMEGKPFAVIETDGHAGDAGTRTRVEAFLHCVREDLRRGGNAFDRDPARLSVGTHPFLEMVRPEDTLLVPAMGPEAAAAAAVFRGMGVHAEVLSATDDATVQAGRRHTSGKECLPLTLTLGALLRRVAEDPEGRFLFLMPTACGPCRLGAYATLDQLVLERLGLRERVRIWSPPWGDYFRGLPSGFSALVFLGLTAMGILEEALHFVRPAERSPGSAEAANQRWAARLVSRLEEEARSDLSASRVLWETSTGRAYGIPRLLQEALQEFRALDSGAELPCVLVTGEIYVRLDPYANGNLARELGRRGLRVLLETTTEVIRYAEHTAWASGSKGGLAQRLERWVQERLFDLCQRGNAALPGLPVRGGIPALLQAAAPYMRADLEGETVLSLGAPIHAWREGRMDAAVIVGPLECMPNKLAEAQLGHVTEREGLPVLALSVNGGALDPEPLDNFVFDVKRRWAERRGIPVA